VAKKSRNAKAGSGKQQRQDPQRKVIVFIALLAVMTATGGLLLALAPAPLAPGAAYSLFAGGTPESLEPIFQTASPIQQGHWRHVYIHQSMTPGGSAATLGESPDGLADHFVIGNGDGCGDGEIQVAQRWDRQKAAGRIPNVQSEPSVIHICLIGDFTQARPTPLQMRRLTQLVNALQDRCGIPAGNVYVGEGNMTSAGVGRYFPTATLREALLP
jgi:hypothetical protein